MKGLTFSEPMMRAWLEGRKTVTRRLMNPQPGMNSHIDQIDGKWIEWWDVELNGGSVDQNTRELKPRYLPGETVYIKETWCEGPVLGAGSGKYEGRMILYRATDTGISAQWKSPRSMLEWASRSHALIVSVRPERVQAITADEVLREGLEAVVENCFEYVEGISVACYEVFDEQGTIENFADLWESLHPGSWERNDWVWRIELRKDGKAMSVLPVGVD